MGFVGEILNGESGIAWYYIVGLLVFLSLFIVIVYRTARMKGSDIETYKESLFEGDELNSDK